MTYKELFSGNEIAVVQKCLWYLGLTKKDPEVGFIAARIWVLIISLMKGVGFEISYQWE